MCGKILGAVTVTGDYVLHGSDMSEEQVMEIGKALPKDHTMLAQAPCHDHGAIPENQL